MRRPHLDVRAVLARLRRRPRREVVDVVEEQPGTVDVVAQVLQQRREALVEVGDGAVGPERALRPAVGVEVEAVEPDLVDRSLQVGGEVLHPRRVRRVDHEQQVVGESVRLAVGLEEPGVLPRRPIDAADRVHGGVAHRQRAGRPQRRRHRPHRVERELPPERVDVALGVGHELRVAVRPVVELHQVEVQLPRGLSERGAVAVGREVGDETVAGPGEQVGEHIDRCRRLISALVDYDDAVTAFGRADRSRSSRRRKRSPTSAIEVPELRGHGAGRADHVDLDRLARREGRLAGGQFHGGAASNIKRYMACDQSSGVATGPQRRTQGSIICGVLRADGDLFGQVEGRGRLPNHPVAGGGVLGRVAGDRVVPAEPRRQQDPLAAAVVGVARIAVDAAGAAAQLLADRLDGGAHDRIGRVDDGERQRQPEQARVDPVVGRALAQQAVAGEPAEQRRAHLGGLVHVGRVVEQLGGAGQTRGDGGDGRGVLPVAELLPAVVAVGTPRGGDVAGRDVDGLPVDRRRAGQPLRAPPARRATCRSRRAGSWATPRRAPHPASRDARRARSGPGACRRWPASGPRSASR